MIPLLAAAALAAPPTPPPSTGPAATARTAWLREPTHDLSLDPMPDIEGAVQGPGHHATVSILPDGSWATVWVPNDDGRGEVVFVRGERGQVTDPAPVLVAPGSNSHPQVGPVGDRWALAWTEHTTGALQLRMADDVGGLDPVAPALDVSGPSRPPNYVDLADLGNGTAVATWLSKPPGSIPLVVASLVDTTGASTPPVTLGQGGRGPTSLAAQDDEAVLAWVNRSPTDDEVVVERVDANLDTVWGPVVAATDAGLGCAAERTAVAVDDRIVVVAWQCEETVGVWRSFVRLLDADDGRLLRGVLPGGAGDCAFRPSVALVDGLLLVAWEDCTVDDAHEVVFEVRNPRTVHLVAPPIRLTPDPGWTHGRPDLSVRLNALGEVDGALTWETTELATGANRVRARRVRVTPLP